MKLHIYPVLLLFVFLAACGDKKTIQNTENTTNDSMVTLTDAQIKNAGIETGPIEQRQISSVLRLNGVIDVPPQNMVSISVPLGGFLKSTNLLPGMYVKKGGVIAVMEDQQYIQMQQDYLTAKAKIVYLESEYNRQKELNRSKASSDKAYQQAEAEYKSQKVLITALAQKLKLAGIDVNQINEGKILNHVNLYSPIDGYVTKVNVNIGKYVSPTDILFELVNPTDIHLALKVFEKDLNKLYVGQRLVAYTNNDPQKKYAGSILLIGKDLSGDRNTDVHCHFDTYDKSLVPGTYMNAEVEVKNIQANVLPNDAIVQYEGKQYVYQVRNNHEFEIVAVNTGVTENNYTEIIFADRNSAPKDKYVVKGAYSLLMLMKNKSE